MTCPHCESATTVERPDRTELGSRPQVIPFTNQTRLTFDVVLPLWGPRGPRLTLPSARAQRSPLC